MAVVQSTVAEVKGFGEYAHIITWSSLANGDTGSLLEMAGSNIMSVQFDGTFGVGGTIVLQGSNDGVTWFTLTDPQANNISKTGAALEIPQERTRYIRPNVTAGDGTTSLNTRLLLRRATR